MNPGIKKRWIAALRSGEYRKARGMLCRRDRGTHCCLGVLREVVGSGEPDGRGLLEYSTLARTGLTSFHQETLARVNDNVGGWDDVIAYIEANL